MEAGTRRAYGAEWLTMAELVGPVAAWAYNPAAGDFTRIEPRDLRILSYNTQQKFIADSSRDEAFNRLLGVIDPDVAVFQEVAVGVPAGQVASRLDSVLPNATSWQTNDGLSDGYSRVVVASRYPLGLQRNDTVPPASTRGVNLCLVDLPSSYASDVYILGVHLKAGGYASDEAKRQRSADAIAAWMGDARQAGGYISLAANTPMIAVGDFNLVTGPQAEATLIRGDIVDNGTFGPDVKGDWDASDLLDLRPADPFTGDIDTWPADSTPDSRMDRFIYADSVTTVGARFILNSLTMSPAARTAAGLQIDDTTATRTSDHLPIIMDVRVGTLGCPTPFPDADRDGDVDQSDFGAWQVCTQGMDLPVAEACLCFDGDGDRDLDAVDLNAFVMCMGGANQPPTASCGGS